MHSRSSVQPGCIEISPRPATDSAPNLRDGRAVHGEETRRSGLHSEIPAHAMRQCTKLLMEFVFKSPSILEMTLTLQPGAVHRYLSF